MPYLNAKTCDPDDFDGELKIKLEKDIKTKSYSICPDLKEDKTVKLEIVRDNYNGNVHISLGMTTSKEEDDIFSFFLDKKQNHRLILYSCTSGYPVDFNDVCMLEIRRLKKKFGESILKIGIDKWYKNFDFSIKWEDFFLENDIK